MKILYIIIITSSFNLNGCIGTGTSRIPPLNDKEATWYGEYPYRSIADDVGIVILSGTSIPETPALGILGIFAGIISIPFDIVVDTVLLPVDLIGWSRGKKKGNGMNTLLPRIGP